jgi:hypothetical protein
MQKTQFFGSPERCVENLRKVASEMEASECGGVFKYAIRVVNLLPNRRRRE